MLGWTNAWNKIVREIIWPDYELKRLMKISPKTGILQFNQRYFIRAGYSSELLTDEVCRIIYSDSASHDTDVSIVKRNTMIFDVFVKQEEMFNIGDDRLISRLDYICNKLDKLLRQKRYLADTAYRFWPAEAPLDIGSRTKGYARRTLAYNYMRVD